MTNSALPDDAINTIVKRKRGNPALDPNGSPLLEPGDNARYIDFALASFNLPKVDLSDTKAVEERINWYFARCKDHDMKPGVVGLANALGVSRKTLWSWKNGVRGVNTPESVDIIKRAYNFLEELWEDYMLNGRISPPNGIFLGKNHFNYTDVQDIVVTPNSPLDGLSNNEARNRYTQALPDTAEDGE